MESMTDAPVPAGKFSDYDIPNKKFDFRTDLAFGKKGEKLVEDFLDSMESGAFEVKTDRYRNGKMVLEMEHNPRRLRDENDKAVWKPSGLSVTKATWWVYVLTLDGTQGAFHIISVERIKRYLKVNKDIYKKSTMINMAWSSSNPSRGYLLLPEAITDLMTNEAYDAV